MQLSQLLQSTEILESFMPLDHLEVDFITNDSRQMNASSLYIAIPGAHVDGHSFLKDVKEKGGRAAIVETIDQSLSLAQYRVANSRRSWSSLSATYFGQPSRDFFVYGITATNGKTTIAFMLDEILRAAGKNTGLIGTVKIRTGKETTAAAMTTPESFELQSYLAQMKEAQLDTVTMEVSSLALEQERSADVSFDVVSFNNFSREHIDQHGSLEVYWNSKAKLMTEAKPTTVTILNVSDEKICELKGKTSGQEVTYSVDSNDGDLYPKDLDLSGNYPKFTLVVSRDIHLKGKNSVTIPAQRIPIELSTPGVHTVANAMACCTMALCQGISAGAIQDGLKNFRGLERRFELIYDGPFKVIDDHFANMDNIETSLKSLSGLHYNKLHMVYAIRGNRGVTVNRENIETLARWLPKLNMDEIIVTETKGEVTPKDFVFPEEKAVFFEEIAKTPLKVTFRETMDEVLDYALEQVQPGDILFLAGTQGMDMGGRKLLEKLSDKDPQHREEIMAAVKDRICG